MHPTPNGSNTYDISAGGDSLGNLLRSLGIFAMTDHFETNLLQLKAEYNPWSGAGVAFHSPHWPPLLLYGLGRLPAQA